MGANLRRQGGRWGLLLSIVAALSGCSDRLDEYVFEDGKFRVRMPARPKAEHAPDLPKSIQKVSLLQRSGTYDVAWQDLVLEKDLGPEERLEKACDGGGRAL